jgi:hypothetical protein
MGVQNTKILLFFSTTSPAPLVDRNRPLLLVRSRRNYRHRPAGVYRDGICKRGRGARQTRALDESGSLISPFKDMLRYNYKNKEDG